MTFLANTIPFIDIDSRNAVFGNVSIIGGRLLVEESFQGTTSGYTSGGSPGSINVIDKFSFATDGNATDVGDLSTADRQLGAAGQSSTTFGYTVGYSAAGGGNVIDKFPFAVNANATDVGDLSSARYASAGQSSSISGYTSGGIQLPGAFSNVIDKFPFAVDANATDVGDLATGIARGEVTGQSSPASGYTSGGIIGPGVVYTNIIDKFPFAVNANATDVGDLPYIVEYPAGQSSTTSGYTSGGQSPSLSPVTVNVISKFPFATDTNATDIADLSQPRSGPTGQSSTVSGYSSGGISTLNTIDKFPFAADGNATDVGDLTVGRNVAAGQQY